MHIRQLRLDSFRNLHATTLDFHPHCTLISGMNASGKTALLEALYYLGRAKSFRESKSRHLIGHGQPFFRLIARFEYNGQDHLLGIERSPQNTRLRLDGNTLKSISKQAKQIPIQIINSDYFALISQGPEYRRRFIDYGLFYHRADFLQDWQRYQYALKNRNAALRLQWQIKNIRPWNQMLAETGERISIYRKNYIEHLQQALNAYHAGLGGLDEISIHYYRGWHGETSLYEQLEQNNQRDSMLKYTRDGIHRADIRFTTGNHDIAHLYSRGQQKTLICALMLAQSRLIHQDSGQHPAMLIDDIAAELDQQRQQLLLTFLANSGAQLFITHIDNQLPLPPQITEYVRLHLDAGRIEVQNAGI